MSQTLAGLTFPSDRTLLARTKLAYVNLPRLLSDAKRDRSARVSGYVCIWLPECLLLLYLKSGELVNASYDTGRVRQALALSDALAKVPVEPEYGAISFHEASDEQLACMYTSHSVAPVEFGASLPVSADDVWAQVAQSEFTGFVELNIDGHVNYLICDQGKVVRGFLSGSSERPLAERAARALADNKGGGPTIKCYQLRSELPAQALPALVKAYRELMASLVQHLVEGGRASAPAIAEHARKTLLAGHPTLAGFALDGSGNFDPVSSPAELSRDIGAWVTETMWAGMDIEGGAPEEILRAIARDRRHMFYSAGFFEHVPWKVEW